MLGGARPDRLLSRSHLLDFDGDLYGQTMRVEFVRRQRGEKRFPSADALVEQMKRDKRLTRAILVADDQAVARARAFARALHRTPVRLRPN